MTGRTLAVLAALWPALAAAEPVDPAVHVRRAKAAADAGDPDQAAAWWAEAARLDPIHRPEHARALAATAGGCPAAGRVLDLAAAECADACGPVTAMRAELEPRCAIDARLVSDPPGARFTVDEQPVDTTTRLWAGPRRIVARWRAETRSLTVCAGPDGPPMVRVARDDPTTIDPARSGTDRAQAHQEAAFAHVRAGAACAAAAEFAVAYAADPQNGFLFNEAVALALTPDGCGAAIEAFDRYLAVCPDCAQATDARTRRRALRAGCEGTLRVRVDVPGARIAVDGAPTAVESQRLPGVHRIAVTAPEHHPARAVGAVRSGQVREVAVPLLPVAAAPTTPPPPPVTSPALPPVPPPVGPAPSLDRRWIAVGLGVSAAGFIAGGAFTALAVTDRDDFVALEQQARTDPSQSYRTRIEAQLDAFYRDRTLGVVGFAVGGAALVATGIYWLTDDADGLAVGPGGVWYGGAF